MKSYHTEIVIDGNQNMVWDALVDFKSYPDWNPIVGKLEGKVEIGKRISTFIKPLNQTFKPLIISFKQNSELIWRGEVVHSSLLCGEHYYKLEKLSENRTLLLHGETFTGILSSFISAKLINKMESAFLQHNLILKGRIENAKK